MAKKASELKGIFLPVPAPVGVPRDATLRTDPWHVGIEKLSPEQYARRRIELAAFDHSDASIRIHVPGGGTHAYRCDVLRRWLLNGSTAMSAAELTIVIEALNQPINEPVDPLANAQDLVERQNAIGLLRARLETDRARRR